MTRTSNIKLIALASAVVACGYSDALESDPTAHDPAIRVQATPPGAGGAGAPAGPACSDEDPPFDPELMVSSPKARSHRAGEPCLAACHVPGGSAELAFAAAGTAFVAEHERTPAGAGRVIESVGGTRLTLDECGNFYAVPSALKSSVRNTQPWVKDPIFRRMEKSLVRVANAGDCNQSGCHDFSGRLNSGIYY